MSTNAVNYTFVPPFNPDWGLKREFKPRVLKVEFGDGYSQRAADGYNNNPVMLSLMWNNLTTSEKDSIIAFLSARKGYQSFWYTYNDETTPKAYVCEEFDYEHTDPTNYTINATFRQVYDIGAYTSTGSAGGGSAGTGGTTSPYQDYSISLSYSLGEYWKDGVKLLGGYTALPGFSFSRTGTAVVLDTETTVGPERLRYADFLTSGAWTTQAGWVVNTTTGTATATSVSGNTLASTGDLCLIIGRTYRVQFTVSSWTSGSLNLYLGQTSVLDVATGIGATGTYYFDIKATAANGIVYFQGTSSATLTISRVSVKEVETGGVVTYDMELATNGTFDSSSGWTTASGASVANHVLALGTTNGASATRLLANAVNIGDEYEIVVNVKSLDSANTPMVRVGQTGTDSLYLSKALLLGKNIFRFVATVASTTGNTTIVNTAGPGTTGTIVEDISIKRMLRDATITQSNTELAPYGDFGRQTEGVNWSLTGGCTIAGGNLNFTASTQTAQRTLTTATQVGERYQATITVLSETANGFALKAGTVATPNLYTDVPLGVGTNIVRWTATTASSTPVVQLYNNGTGVGSITKITVRKLSMDAFDTFAANVPEIVAGRGFMAHPSLTNNVLQSQTLATTWTALNVTVTSNVMLAPDGTLTADLVNEGTGVGVTHWLSQSYTNAATGLFTTSVFAKAGTGQFIQLIDDHLTGGSNFCNFDLINGVVGSSAGLTGSMIYCGDGWWRCIVSASAASTSAQPLYLIMVTSNAVGRAPTYTGTSKTVYLWQAQAVNGLYIQGGPVIVTTTAGSTLGALAWTQDYALDTDADFLAFADVDKVWATSGTQYVFNFSDGTTNNYVSVSMSAGNQDTQVASGATGYLNDAVTPAIIDGSRVFLFVRRYGGVWQHGYLFGGVIHWGGGSATVFPSGLTKLNVGYGFGSNVVGLIRTFGVNYATYDTDAKIIALAQTLGATP
jgi:phage-related protein